MTLRTLRPLWAPTLAPATSSSTAAGPVRAIGRIQPWPGPLSQRRAEATGLGRGWTKGWHVPSVSPARCPPPVPPPFGSRKQNLCPDPQSEQHPSVSPCFCPHWLTGLHGDPCNSYAEVLNPQTSEGDSIWRRRFKEAVKLEWGHQGQLQVEVTSVVI